MAQKIQDIYAGIAENDMRNALLISGAVRLLEEKRTPLLLTERKDYATRLAEELQNKADHVCLIGIKWHVLWFVA